jgi:TetR/AcrR family transcriptional repressor of nem operon
MPRVSRAERQRNHLAIQRASGQLLRQRGLHVSVADLMAAAGLTHGGLYGHFGSKEQLLAAGCADAFRESAARWRGRIAAADGRAAALTALIEHYLADDGPLITGCPIASLATDVARAAHGRSVHAAFCEGLGTLHDILATLQSAAGTRAARERALLQLSSMVGALILARATRGHPLSAQLLAVARRHLRAAAPPRRRRAAASRKRTRAR